MASVAAKSKAGGTRRASALATPNEPFVSALQGGWGLYRGCSPHLPFWYVPLLSRSLYRVLSVILL